MSSASLTHRNLECSLLVLPTFTRARFQTKTIFIELPKNDETIGVMYDAFSNVVGRFYALLYSEEMGGTPRLLIEPGCARFVFTEIAFKGRI